MQMSGFSVLKLNGNMRKCNGPMYFIFIDKEILQ